MKAKPETRGRPSTDGVPADAQIHIRTTAARKSAYVHAAKPGKLSDWITRHLDAAAGYRPGKE